MALTGSAVAPMIPSGMESDSHVFGSCALGGPGLYRPLFRIDEPKLLASAGETGLAFVGNFGFGIGWREDFDYQKRSAGKLVVFDGSVPLFARDESYIGGPDLVLRHWTKWQFHDHFAPSASTRLELVNQVVLSAGTRSFGKRHEHDFSVVQLKTATGRVVQVGILRFGD